MTDVCGMTTEERLAEAIKALQWIQSYCAPEMQGFESDHDRLLFIRTTRTLGIIGANKRELK